MNHFLVVQVKLVEKVHKAPSKFVKKSDFCTLTKAMR